MKAVVQRVTKACVTVGGDPVGSIGPGLCVLLGISVDDTQRDAEYMVRKILNLRLFEDEDGRAWSRSVVDRDLEVLCVSQFTLQCVLKGNKPDFRSAMPAQRARPLYGRLLEDLRAAYKPERVKDGRFGARMQLDLQNDGPVTVELMSPAAPAEPRQLSKQQQRKDKTRPQTGPESGWDRSGPEPGASSGADGDVPSERET